MTKRHSKQSGRAPNGAPRAWIAWAFAQETDECLEWPYAYVEFAGQRYGVLSTGERINNSVKTELAHHAILKLKCGSRPDGHEGRHHCGGKLCCNKRHLSWATHADNMSDKHLHGTHLTGEDNPQSKLTCEDVINIENDLRNTVLKQTDIAKKYNVHQSQISRINKGKHELSSKKQIRVRGVIKTLETNPESVQSLIAQHLTRYPD